VEQLKFPGTLDALEPIRKYVERVAQSAGLDHQATYKLCLAVDEIATNVVLHGYEEAGLSGDITIGSSIENDNLVIELEDHGKPYNPNFHALPSAADLAQRLESREIGGLGIYLALDGVDDLQYNSTPSANIHRFIVRLLPQSESAE
jgi:anti-sigma regulatory factor (Ser/Thr protein kinase)